MRCSASLILQLHHANANANANANAILLPLQISPPVPDGNSPNVEMVKPLPAAAALHTCRKRLPRRRAV